MPDSTKVIEGIREAWDQKDALKHRLDAKFGQHLAELLSAFQKGSP